MNHNALDPTYLARIAERVAKERIQERTLEKKVEPKPEIVIQNPIAVPDPNKIIINRAPINNGYIYVPSLNFYLAKHRTLQNNDWCACHRKLQANGERMPTIPEFIEFIKYLKANPNGVADASSVEVTSILDETLTERPPFRGEWLDADFQLRNDGSQSVKIYINYNHLVQGSSLTPKNSEELINCLMSDETPGIRFDEWLDNYNKHGLPMPNISSGNLYYWYPKIDNNSVARFCADWNWSGLNCSGGHHFRDSDLGVRAVKRMVFP